MNRNGVRIATYNIWGCHGAWTARRPVLTAALQSVQPDVIAFQKSVVVDSFDQIADLLESSYHNMHLSGRSDDGVGASIASRWPVQVVRELALHLTPRVDATLEQLEEPVADEGGLTREVPRTLVVAVQATQSALREPLDTHQLRRSRL